MSSVADIERVKAHRARMAMEMTTPLLEPNEQQILIDEIVGRLQVQVAKWVAEAVIQPGRVSAWRILFDAEWKAKPAIDVVFHELREETLKLAGKSPAPAPLGCPEPECEGHLVVDRRLLERVPIVGLETGQDGAAVYLEGVRNEIECDELLAGVCTECGTVCGPEEYQRPSAADALAQQAG